MSNELSKLFDQLNLNLDPHEAERLLRVLVFAYDTAKFMVTFEETKGSPGGVEKITTYMNDADHFLNKIQVGIAMAGRPSDGELN